MTDTIDVVQQIQSSRCWRSRASTSRVWPSSWWPRRGRRASSWSVRMGCSPVSPSGCWRPLNVIALGFLLSRARGERAVESISTKCEPGGVLSSGDPAAAAGARSGSVEGGVTIQVDDVADSGRPFEAVRIQGAYHGGADALLRVQRWEEGKWLAFPVPARTDQSGQFTTYVEFGQPGRLPASRAGPGL